MAKMLNQRDFDLSRIGEKFELDEVIPKYRQEKRANENGETILQRDGKPRMFNTEEIIGYKYSVTILSGEFKKKATQITVDRTDNPITNEEIMKRESVKCHFEELEPSFIGNPMYYRASKIVLEKQS